MNYNEKATKTAQVLMGYYRKDCGFFSIDPTKTCESMYGWGTAVALESMIDYMNLTKTGVYDDILGNTFDKGQEIRKNFINDYYDDTCWWAISMMKAYDYLKKSQPEQAEKYLTVAKNIHQELITGWDEVCGGGIYWRKNPKKYKAAIQNELFMVVSIRLYQRTQDDQYKNWAIKVWEWFKNTKMLTTEHLIMNGLDSSEECICYSADDKKIWTYNQGVILGGLVDLYQVTSEEDLLTTAQNIANAAIKTLCYDNKVLKECCETEAGGCNGDAKCFKGIFMRYLAYLYKNLPKDNPYRAAYQCFITLNANSVWDHAKNDKNQFGSIWIGPFDKVTIGTQMSALDVFNAAIQVNE